MKSHSESALPHAVPRVQAGDKAAFDELARPHVPKLRATIRRLVAHPDDTDDITQESLLQAFEKIESFRGEARFSTWLCAIGVRKALDYLRQRKRWRVNAQLIAERECHSVPAKGQQMLEAQSGPDHVFDVYEHIAFCFTCVARTLTPQEMGALVLRDVGGYSTDEAARMLKVSRSVLRHSLSAARQQMQHRFADLCSLVNKRGACWQCETLRGAHESGKRGPPLPDFTREPAGKQAQYRRRLTIVREADIDRGRAQAVHDLAWRWLEELASSGPS